MTVLLATSRHLPDRRRYRHWCAAAGAAPGIDQDRRLPLLTTHLEESYDAVAEQWWALGRRLAEEPSAGLAHAPAAAANASDLGLMLAWSRLVADLAAGTDDVLVVCDDPWLYRHLASLAGVEAEAPPPLWPRTTRLALRGVLTRLVVSGRCAFAALRERPGRGAFRKGAPVLLVYGHPASDADGTDAYFGDLMKEMPELVRLLHVDCPPARAGALAGGGRTFSLHAWGGPLAAFGLVGSRWQPTNPDLSGDYGWLVRRAAALEGSTGQPAMIRWQQMCQEAWLDAVRPGVVAWPWENHAWERHFVRLARRFGVKTIGYQHATIGRREWNYAAASNHDGTTSLPDRILASGPASQALLRERGFDAARVSIGGALRVGRLGALPFDPSGPVFVALPYEATIAAEMVAAIRPLGATGRRFVVKDHPMTPFEFDEGPGVERTVKPLDRQGGLSAVIYAMTTVGLEAVIGGLPTLRFQAETMISSDPVPQCFAVSSATSKTVAETLDSLQPPSPVDPQTVFAKPRPEIWRDALLGEVAIANIPPAPGRHTAGGLG